MRLVPRKLLFTYRARRVPGAGPEDKPPGLQRGRRTPNPKRRPPSGDTAAPALLARAGAEQVDGEGHRGHMALQRQS